VHPSKQADDCTETNIREYNGYRLVYKTNRAGSGTPFRASLGCLAVVAIQNPQLKKKKTTKRKDREKKWGE